MEKTTIWDTVQSAPPEFWAGVAVGLALDRFLKNRKARKADRANRSRQSEPN